MPKVKVGDINIYYEMYGDGEPLVLISGYGSSLASWFRQVPAFSQEYRVVVFDNRGTGQSDKPDIPYSAEMMVDDLTGLLQSVGIKAAHIFGVSLGGGIAQYFALRYPAMVISLILGCTTCGGFHRIKPDAGARKLPDIEHMQKLTLAEVAKERLSVIVSQEFIDKNPDVVQQIIAKGTEHPTPLHGYIRQQQATIGFDTYELLPEIKMPTLVIAGDADCLIPVENSRLLASRIPRAELVILEGMGHGFFFEAENETNRVVLNFVRRHRLS